MNEDIKSLKEAFSFLGARYIMSEELKDYAYIRFNYKDRNYKLHINHQYKFILLEQTDSLKGIYFDVEVRDLLEDIRLIKSTLQISSYNIFATAVKNEMLNGILDKGIEITKEINNLDLCISVGAISTNNKLVEGTIIPYNFGLNSFDERLFNGVWLEDFNEKVLTYDEEDLYIMYSTLISYFYKLSENKWKGYAIDPFVISDVLEILLNEIKRREDDFYTWFNMWSEYFDSPTIEKYLSKKERTKEKHLE